MIIYGDGRNEQNDKHHCNTPPIWPVQIPDSVLSSVKTHENPLGIGKKTPKGLSDCEKQDFLVLWSLVTMYRGKQAMIITSTIPSPTVKCGACSLMLWVLVRVEGMLNTMTFIESLNENLVQSIQSLRLGRKWVAYGQVCVCHWVTQPEHGLEVKIKSSLFL